MPIEKGTIPTVLQGNDDQMFWGLAAITAAEYNLPNRPEGPTWLTLAIRVYNDQKDSSGGWDESFCGGGIRWQKDLWLHTDLR